MPRLSPRLGLFLLMLLMGMAIYWRYPNLLQHLPSKLVIEAWSDGYKTYMNTIYHIRHDSLYHHFSGMNYPYGEPIMQATELPGLAIFLRALQPVFPNISEYVFGIIHGEMLLSLFLSAMFLYLILVRWKLPVWYAIPAAIAIAFLAPQNLRMSSHYGLAQHFLIPLLLWLLVLFEERPRWWISLGVAGAIVLGSFLHFYFFAICTFLVGGYLVFSAWQNREQHPLPHYVFHFGLMLLIPLVFFLFFSILPDPVSDRSPKPYGFLIFKTNLEGFFLNPDHPFYKWSDGHWIDIRKTEMEGQVYLGFPAIAMLFLLFFRWLGFGFRRRFLYFLEPEEHFQRLAFGSTFLIALFSMGLPFIIPPLPEYLDYMGPLQQFRSIGRFAWPFFYVWNVLAFLAWYRMIEAWKKPLWQWLISLLLLVVLIQDVYFFTHRRNLELQQVTHLTRGPSFTELGIDFSKYQAVIPVPYYNVGSNNFVAGGTGFSMQRSLTIGIQTGIPTTGAMLARSSRSQAMRQWQLIKEPYRVPIIFEDYPNKKPLLLFWSKKMKPEQEVPYRHLLEGALLIYEDERSRLYEVPLQAFADRIQERTERVLAEITDSLYAHGSLLSTDSVENFVYRDFEEESSGRAYAGSGSSKGILHIPTIIWDGAIPHAQTDTSYWFHAWAYVGEDRLTSNVFLLEEVRPDGSVASRHHVHTWRQTATIDPDWVLVEYEFRLKDRHNSLRISYGREQMVERASYVDELLVRPASTDVYQKADNLVWKNGRFWPID